MKAFLFVGVGGLLGAVLRYQVGRWVATSGRQGEMLLLGLPLATLFVNVTGSFMIGVFVAGFSGSPEGIPNESLRLLLVTGFLGAFTTFSSFSIETLQLLQQGSVWLALGNVLLNVIFCLLAVAIGYALGGHIQSWLGA